MAERECRGCRIIVPDDSDHFAWPGAELCLWCLQEKSAERQQRREKEEKAYQRRVERRLNAKGKKHRRKVEGVRRQREALREKRRKRLGKT
jgi:hypothetical protein